MRQDAFAWLVTAYDSKSVASCQQACCKLLTDWLQVYYFNRFVAIYLFSFVETPRKFIIAELSIRKLGSSSVLLFSFVETPRKYIIAELSIRKL